MSNTKQVSASGSNILAARPCVTCRLRKRKCDRTFPICEACVRLMRKCQYDEKTTSRQTEELRRSTRHRGEVTSEESIRNFQTRETSSLGLIEAFSFPNSHSDYEDRTQLAQELFYRDDIVSFMGTMDELKSKTSTYFLTVHRWLPIISKVRFFTRLPEIWAQQDAGLLLLAYCMCLLTQSPSENESMQSPRYAAAKSLIAFFESTGLISMEVLQSRLLVALYEMGHGIPIAASISIAACERIGSALGIDQKWRQERPESHDDWSELEEKRRVWWGVFVLDRFINLEGAGPNFTAKDPGLEDSLPADDGGWDANIPLSHGTLPMSTPYDNRVSCFAREAQACHLLGRVLRHVYDPSPDEDFNLQEQRQLDSILQAYSVLLPVEAAETGALYCGPVGICASAQLLLRKAKVKGECDNTARFNSYQLRTIEVASKGVLNLASGFHAHVALAGTEGACPFTPHCIYHSATVQALLAKETGDEHHTQQFNLLKSMLRTLGKRWRVASLYLYDLESNPPH